METMGVTQPPAAGVLLNGAASGSGRGAPANSNNVKGSELNAIRISAVIDRLSAHLLGRRIYDNNEFVNLCLSLSRGIDFSLANSEVPSRYQELPPLLRQVCQIKNDPSLEAAVMVLMISVKIACQRSWFSDEVTVELLNLAKEIGTRFCDAKFNTEPSSSLPVISTIMSRFYPTMKMGHILVFLEIKPGFDAYLSDFQISKALKSSSGDKIRLLVVQTDSIETSACLVSPAKVNFILNGKQVERRTIPIMESGPQLPTLVTHILKYGSNLLQAVGEFNGNYAVAVAFMSEIPIPDSSSLQDYEHHAPATVDLDSEIIVGPSRISLNCPISYTRLKTPVKGHSCKHFQCFDFDNYVKMNSRRPSWRCPHCNQQVCFTDIRIDQKMVEILKEVGQDVSVITVSADGSWNAVMEKEETTEKPENRRCNTEQDESQQPANVLDLTQNDDPMDVAVTTNETEDRKNFPNDQFMMQTTVINPHVADVNDISQDDLWSEIDVAAVAMVPSNVRSNAPIAGVSTSEAEAFLRNHLGSASVSQSGVNQNLVQSQQYPIVNPSMTVTAEYGRYPSIPSHITRSPIAIQALPARSQIPQQSPRNSANTFNANGLSASPNVSPVTPNFSSPIRPNPHRFPSTSSSQLVQQPRLQQSSSFPSGRQPQQNTGNFQDPNQVPNLLRYSSERHSSSQQMQNLRMPRQMSQSPSTTMQSPRSYAGPQNHTGVSQERSIHRTPLPPVNQAHLIAAANRSMQMAIDPTRTAPSYSWNTDVQSMPSVADQRVTSQPIPSTNAYDPGDMNWRPAARMRGALSGNAYNEAFNQFIVRPSQQLQAARPATNMPNIPAQLQALMANQVPSNPSAGSSGRLPDGPPGMN